MATWLMCSLPLTPILPSKGNGHQRKEMSQVHTSMSTESHRLRCPFCEDHTDHDSGRCLFDRGFLSEELLETLHRVTTELPGILSTTSRVNAASASAWR